MIAEAMQGVAVFAAVSVPLGFAVNRWMCSDSALPHGYEDATARQRRWSEVLHQPQPRLRTGGRS